MIETLNGIVETVHYLGNTKLKFYLNQEYEDYPPHWHTPVEIIMPTRGGYSAVCGDERYELQEGDILFICPGAIHSLYAPKDGERIIFQIGTSSLSDIKDVDTVLSLLSPAILITAKDHPHIHEEIQKIIRDIQDKYFGDSFFSESYIYSKFLMMLSLIGQNYTHAADQLSSNLNRQQEYTDMFLTICDYISSHCTEDLTLDQVAEQAGFSKFYFTRLFKQFTNVSFYKYLNQKRIAMAETLLIDEKNSITDVALGCGFSSLSAFIRMFKIVKGCTPTEYRKMQHEC
ncbi:MAG: AraC family transcriptional regulator [Lachnospiraceae bacterium]|nr:AraC family transcriptional regulator [Lachnospiraceae bacterium]